MTDNGKINRRSFIKTSSIVGGAFFMKSILPGQAMEMLPKIDNAENDKLTGDAILKGVCDIHLHCSPDSRERCIDEYHLCKMPCMPVIVPLCLSLMISAVMTRRILYVRHYLELNVMEVFA